MAKCNGTVRQLQTPAEEAVRLRWQEVSKLQHHWLDIDAVEKPMEVHDNGSPYAIGRQD
ncbi:MAG: hypothetical protein GX600_05855 [Dehalococcoidia bacterium]|nr:hypothetical protein [Dehalococcoidia bacterium]